MRNLFKRLFIPSLWDLPTFGQWAVILSPTVATSVAGIVINESLMWLIVGTTLTFAGTFAGLVSFRIYRFQNDPRHKFKFMCPAVRRPTNSVQIGFDLCNDAIFPISVEIVELTTTCAMRTTPPDRNLRNREFVLAPGERTFYYDAAIDIQGVTDLAMESTLEVTMKYGHQGNPSIEMKKSFNVHIPFDANLGINWTPRDTQVN